jgi:hypothetical protein
MSWVSSSFKRGYADWGIYLGPGRRASGGGTIVVVYHNGYTVRDSCVLLSVRQPIIVEAF